MKKIVFTSLMTAAFIATGVSSSRSQPGKPVSDTLNTEYCQSNFVACTKVSEAALISNYVYGGDWKEKIDKQLKQNGAGWNKGFTEISYEDTGSNYDAQFVIAKKKVKLPGEDKEKTYFLVGIRGTEGFADFVTDAQAVPITYPNGMEIHSGFNNYANAIITSGSYKKMIGDITEINQRGEDYEVLVTGHSLGGASATIVKAHLQEYFPNVGDKISAVTFGAPPVGNQKFKDLYEKRVISIVTERDAVPSIGINAVRVGEEWKFEDPTTTKLRKQDPTSRLLNRVYNLINPLQDIAEKAKTIVVDPFWDNHLSYFEKDRYKTATNNGWYDLREELMHRSLNNITQGGSSHIGSASYYLGRSPREDSINIQNAYQVETFDGARIQSVPEKEQYTTPAGSITNLKAPVDIVLNWDKSVAKGQLDLDSHLTGPVSLGDASAVRFHTYFSSKGAQNTAPFVFLYRDVIPAGGGTGDEQTRIQVLQNGVYRFYVHDYTNKDSTSSTALSNSGANVNVYNGGNNLPTEGQNLGTPLGGAIKVPTNQPGNTWRVFELDSRTGVLKPVNAPLTNISSPASVPQAGEANTESRGGPTTTK